MRSHRYSIILLLSLFARPASAQQVIFYEGFEYMQSSNFCCGWGVTGNPGSAPWHNGIFYMIGTDCFPEVNNYTRVAGISDLYNPVTAPCSYLQRDSDVLLYTPLIHLNGVPNASFTYDSYFSKKSINGRSERASVEISTDSGATWTVLAAAPIAPDHHMVPGYADLSPYTAYPSIRLGFRYSDSGQHMTGWMIDNLKIYVPAQHDIALAAATPADTMRAFAVTNDSVALGGTVFNKGAQPVHAFAIHYQWGAGPVFTDSVTGVNILTFGLYGFQHHKSFVIPGPGRYPFKMWVSMAGDADHSNDSATVILHGASFIPLKALTVEAGTGTWYVFGPQTGICLAAMRATDYPVTLVSIHGGDVLQDPVYRSYVSGLRLYSEPYILFDRRVTVPLNRIVGIPMRGVYYIYDLADVLGQFDIQRQYFGFADIILSPSISGNQLSVIAGVRPAIDLTGDYRLALAITEDSVQGADTAFDQANAFSGGAFGPMGGYEALPNPVPASVMRYNYVARDITPAPDGNVACLPPTMSYDMTYNCTLNATLNPAWIKRRLTASVLLIHADDSSILNSKSISVNEVLGIAGAPGAGSNAALYPNPADQSVNILLTLQTPESVAITITDIAGRTVFAGSSVKLESGSHNIPLRTDGLANGMYLIQLRTGTGRQTLKLDVIH